jgi:ABC-type nitrate/sulfonate/bicarbonate transport system substrate-binding protein
MVNVLTGNQLAGGAMVFAGLYTTDEYLEDHPEVIEGMLRAWYRTMDYLRANPDEALPIMVDWINEQSGAGFTVEDAERFTQDLVLFPTYEEVRDEYMYNPESPFYWEKRLQFVVDYFGEAEGLDTSAIDLEILVPAPDIFPNVEPPSE